MSDKYPMPQAPSEDALFKYSLLVYLHLLSKLGCQRIVYYDTRE